MEVTNCIFKNIGHYASNVFAVKNTGKAYIADNEFIDTNYGAIYTGQCDCASDSALFSESLIERNYIHYSPEWIEKRKVLGLQDSGDIYITTNNKEAIIRFNRISGTGGVSETNSKRKNNAIYGDDGAYNMTIYCNVISGLDSYYDIHCRDGSAPNENRRTVPTGRAISTNNKILYNVCDGFVKIQENANDNVSDTGCEFRNNFILRKPVEPELQGEVTTGNTFNRIIHCKHGDGIVTDETGMIASATFIALLGNCEILPEQSSD